MQVNRRKYNRARRGAVRLQAGYRGRNVRKVNAATKIESYQRMKVRSSAFSKLKSVTVARQCCIRRKIAKKEFAQLKLAQKDMGKLKENNEKLKMEMASLRGITMYEICSGQHLPASGDGWHDLRNCPCSILPGTMPCLNIIIRQMMHPNPKLRPSATDLLLRDALCPTRLGFGNAVTGATRQIRLPPSKYVHSAP